VDFTAVGEAIALPDKSPVAIASWCRGLQSATAGDRTARTTSAKGNHTFQRSSFLHCTVKAIASHKASSAIAFSLRD